ncbi:acyltransferase [Teichococcus vastitatis]|uniref:Acyltransferase n=1 Tax=Teichococcus vastitatis TaxID=2307076 RepID=A0ABS9VZL9_9PROT|nr:acyltransferase [Pseudoroseomonas vastitatis]MCI0752383.1 acyltransferase [Pseudoroseomonas vastitatis]
MMRLDPAAATAAFAAHPLLRNGLPEGYSPPAFAGGAVEIALDAASPSVLAGHGVVVEGRPSAGDRLLLGGAPPASLRIVFGAAARGGSLFALDDLAPGSQFKLKITGGGHLFAVAGGSGRHNLQVSLRTGEALFLLGRDSSTNGGNAMAEGPGTRMLVGDDAMFAAGVQLRNADSHGIVDLATGEQVNLPEDVLVGPHVWLATGASVMKGVTVGRGAIVAAQAMVTRDVPPCSLVAGIPARVLREGVSWTRQSRPDARRVAALRDSLGWPDG